ncbi:hypothetical protein FLL46_21070 [Aliikangiella coralliicola]|uniref:Na+/H+ antiporter NhaC-like C-terminal domain-containing protein n=2 Tax=Aliikangiella coralliicola TaxID=2592383 RepID=A0A545U6J5_9GAMM|nr:hypothetical protein FLL46_21070 [Aliikangiella coralliicola]
MPAFPTLFVGALLGGLFAVFFQSASIERMVSASIYSCDAVAAESAVAEGTNSRKVKECSVSFTQSKSSPDTLAAVFEFKMENGETLNADGLLVESKASQIISVEQDGQVFQVDASRRSYLVSAIDAVWRAMAKGYQSTTGDATVDELLSRGGMLSMLNPTVWLILCAMTFGAVLEKIGLLQRLVTSALSLVSSTGSLVTTVICTCIGANIIAGDQYIAIVLPGRMYRAEFKRRKLHPKNLSRVLEDSATITSPLIPWNTCGAYMAATLGVSTFAYLPFCFFNLVNPIISVIYGITHFKIEKLADDQSDDDTDVGKSNEEVVLN